MKLILCPILMLFSLFLGAYDFDGTDHIRPGEIYTLLFTPDEGSMEISGDLRISSSSGRVVALAELISLEEVGMEDRWIFLLGIGPEITAGTYTLDVSCQQDGTSIYFRKRLIVETRDFSHQTISLNRNLTALRSEENPRKARESRLLWSVLTQVNPGHIYHVAALSMPVVGDYVTTTEYGARRVYHYDTGEESSTLHAGIDMAAPLGTHIVSPGRGRVALATEMLVTGNTLVLEHLPGVYTVYYHMDTLEVVEDQIVDQGQWLGTMGMTGLSTGSHLHWELRVSRSPVDPEYYLEHSLLDKRAIISMINS